MIALLWKCTWPCSIPISMQAISNLAWWCKKGLKVHFFILGQMYGQDFSAVCKPGCSSYTFFFKPILWICIWNLMSILTWSQLLKKQQSARLSDIGHARNAFTKTYSFHLLSWWVLGGSPDRQLHNQMLHRGFTNKLFPVSHLIIVKLKTQGYGSVFLSMWKVIQSNRLWIRRFWEVLPSKLPSPIQMRNSLDQVISFKFIVTSLFFMPFLPNPWSAS